MDDDYELHESRSLIHNTIAIVVLVHLSDLVFLNMRVPFDVFISRLLTVREGSPVASPHSLHNCVPLL